MIIIDDKNKEENRYLLEVENLKKYFITKKRFFSGSPKEVRAVDGVNLTLQKREILGIVGESGCGKSTLARTILRLINATSGKIYFNSVDILDLSREEMRLMRTKMQIIFQDSGASLNPRMTIGEILEEPFSLFTQLSHHEKEKRVMKLIDMVGLSSAYMSRFPHEFSGGQRQRIGIARAIALQPELVICDEPVSALDVSVRAQILNLIKDMKQRLDLTYIFISHDLSVVNHICDRIMVMYLGRVVETADKNELFSYPAHPYTQSLLSAIPIPDPQDRRDRIILEGDVPSPVNPPSGCHFHPRCLYADDRCSSKEPPLQRINSTHTVTCWKPRLQKGIEG